MGYHDAVYNLFRDFYENLKLKLGEGAEVSVGFGEGHRELLVTEAILSHREKRWVKVL